MGLTTVLAELALDTNAESIPPAAYDAAKKMILDTVGCAVCVLAPSC